MLDDYDRKLLGAVQANSSITARELAERVGLSASAIQRRLKRLKERGVIRAEVALVDPKALGHNFMAIVAVSLDSDRPDIVDRFAKLVGSIPQVLQCHYVTGDTDLILMVVARDVEQYDALARDLFERAGNVKSFRTNVVLATKKTGSALPVIG